MKRPIEKSLREYGRGIAGGMLFSLPLLYTMEVWFHGFIAEPLHFVLTMLVTFVTLLGYNRYAGLRQDSGWSEIFEDSVEELGIGLVVSTLVLLLIGQIGPGVSLAEALGKIVLQSLTVAIGVSIGPAQIKVEEETKISACVEIPKGSPAHSILQAWRSLLWPFAERSYSRVTLLRRKKSWPLPSRSASGIIWDCLSFHSLFRR